MTQYRRVFVHPELGRLEGKLFPETDLAYLRDSNRRIASGNVISQQFICADGREIYLNAAQLAGGVMWLEPVEGGESSAEGSTSPKQFREGAAEAAV